MPEKKRAFLDGLIARLLALLVLGLCAALLAYIHRGDLSGIAGLPAGEQVEGLNADPAAPCITARFAEIDGMVEEGVVDDAQASLFKERAEAMCRATTGEGGGTPPLPLE